MITENDLLEAIAECQGRRNPDAATCIKLAAYYIIYNNMFGEQEEPPRYSYAKAPETIKEVTYESDTDFGKAMQGKSVDDILPLIDELMTTLQAINPRLYNGVMRRL